MDRQAAEFWMDWSLKRTLDEFILFKVKARASIKQSFYYLNVYFIINELLNIYFQHWQTEISQAARA